MNTASEQPLGEADLGLLRAHEPVVAFTAGELFLPTDVEGYVRRCALRRRRADGRSEQLVPGGELTLDRLTREAAQDVSAELYLVFVAQPLTRREVRRRHRIVRPAIARTGRLAAVGLAARVVDLLMRVSLLVRGSVPGGVAAAAAEQYAADSDGRCVYYGRVLRDGGYVILQYWYFYAMNDWRSTFGGVNDHEADWEMVTVYLTEETLRPAWVAFSSHDHTGDDLRRRWDDPDLRRVGGHPVVYAGAGSHSGAVLPGDYLIRVDPPRLRRPVALLQRLAWLIAPWTRGKRLPGVGIPFLDYARGDGVTVGPGGDRDWTPVPIGDRTGWVRQFRGLWGRDTRDPFGGERAPAGPRYERDGRVRTSWADPLGWAGLQKIPADPETDSGALARRIAALDAQLADADTDLDARREALRDLHAAADSLARHAHTRAQAAERRAEVAAAEKELARAYASRSRLAEERGVHTDSLAHPPVPAPPQAHLREPALPYEITQRRRTRFLSAWAAVSTPLFILALAAILLLPGYGSITGLLALVVAFLAVEAVARRQLLVFVVGLLGLCAAGVLVLVVLVALWQNWRITLAVPLAVAALALLVGNLRDLVNR